MWTCQRCQETHEDQFDSCWRCQTARYAETSPAIVVTPDAAPSPRKRVAFQIFRGVFLSWEELFQNAATFADTIGHENLISISHSCDQNKGVVTVWFWTTKSADYES
jgi:hypothetical protein